VKSYNKSKHTFMQSGISMKTSKKAMILQREKGKGAWIRQVDPDTASLTMTMIECRLSIYHPMIDHPGEKLMIPKMIKPR